MQPGHHLALQSRSATRAAKNSPNAVQVITVRIQLRRK
jgi:hypothetical protein